MVPGHPYQHQKSEIDPVLPVLKAGCSMQCSAELYRPLLNANIVL